MKKHNTILPMGCFNFGYIRYLEKRKRVSSLGLKRGAIFNSLSPTKTFKIPFMKIPFMKIPFMKKGDFFSTSVMQRNPFIYQQRLKNLKVKSLGEKVNETKHIDEKVIEIIKSPTGSGKTYTMLKKAIEIAGEGGNAIIAFPNQNLLRENLDNINSILKSPRYRNWGIKVIEYTLTSARSNEDTANSVITEDLMLGKVIVLTLHVYIGKRGDGFNYSKFYMLIQAFTWNTTLFIDEGHLFFNGFQKNFQLNALIARDNRDNIIKDYHELEEIVKNNKTPVRGSPQMAELKKVTIGNYEIGRQFEPLISRNKPSYNQSLAIKPFINTEDLNGLFINLNIEPAPTNSEPRQLLTRSYGGSDYSLISNCSEQARSIIRSLTTDKFPCIENLQIDLNDCLDTNYYRIYPLKLASDKILEEEIKKSLIGWYTRIFYHNCYLIIMKAYIGNSFLNALYTYDNDSETKTRDERLNWLTRKLVFFNKSALDAFDKAHSSIKTPSQLRELSEKFNNRLNFLAQEFLLVFRVYDNPKYQEIIPSDELSLFTLNYLFSKSAYVIAYNPVLTVKSKDITRTKSIIDFLEYTKLVRKIDLHRKIIERGNPSDSLNFLTKEDTTSPFNPKWFNFEDLEVKNYNPIGEGELKALDQVFSEAQILTKDETAFDNSHAVSGEHKTESVDPEDKTVSENIGVVDPENLPVNKRDFTVSVNNGVVDSEDKTVSENIEVVDPENQPVNKRDVTVESVKMSYTREMPFTAQLYLTNTGDILTLFDFKKVYIMSATYSSVVLAEIAKTYPDSIAFKEFENKQPPLDRLYLIESTIDWFSNSNKVWRDNWNNLGEFYYEEFGEPSDENNEKRYCLILTARNADARSFFERNIKKPTNYYTCIKASEEIYDDIPTVNSIDFALSPTKKDQRVMRVSSLLSTTATGLNMPQHPFIIASANSFRPISTTWRYGEIKATDARSYESVLSLIQAIGRNARRSVDETKNQSFCTRVALISKSNAMPNIVTNIAEHSRKLYSKVETLSLDEFESTLSANFKSAEIFKYLRDIRKEFNGTLGRSIESDIIKIPLIDSKEDLRFSLLKEILICIKDKDLDPFIILQKYLVFVKIYRTLSTCFLMTHLITNFVKEILYNEGNFDETQQKFFKIKRTFFNQKLNYDRWTEIEKKFVYVFISKFIEYGQSNFKNRQSVESKFFNIPQNELAENIFHEMFYEDILTMYFRP